jgi:hypothetical protein
VSSSAPDMVSDAAVTGVLVLGLHLSIGDSLSMKPKPKAEHDRRVVADRRSKTRNGRRSTDVHYEGLNARIEQVLKDANQKPTTKKLR